MSLDVHISELRERHKKLEAEISKELLHPSSDHLEIQNLKRKKLKLKEEIERLEKEA